MCICNPFIHSSVSGHLGCFRVLTAVKCAAATLLGKPVPRGGLLGHPVGLSPCFPRWPPQVAISPAVCAGSRAPASQHGPIPGGSRRAGGRRPLPAGLVCASPMVSDAEPLGHLCLVWENIYSYPLPTLKSFFKIFFFFLLLSCMTPLYICVCVYIYVCVCVYIYICKNVNPLSDA